MGAWVAWERGDRREGGEALPRVDQAPEADRRPGDALREPARGSPSSSTVRGRIEEAERFALDARETVGPLDVTSRATTAPGSLAQVRAAQGRDE